ncbi:MAG: PIG-L family deacetylase [Thermoflexus sp.]|uniref:PIG-L deacetylase family protein n=1 Tax=Thermoflexus sp. TaxID=1969742 RepID=UPI00332ADEC5
MREPKPPERVLVVAAHPDDVEFTCAGTLAKWARRGSAIALVLCTSGDAGTEEAGRSREATARIREAEQQAAARVLGLAEVVFLRYPDGLLQPTLELRRDLVREIRRFRPHALVCGDPSVYFYGEDYINHPDHRAAAQAALEAAFPAAGMPLLFPELGLPPHRVREIYIYGAAQPNVWVDIEETLPLKAEALRCHRSQIGDWDPEPTLRAWAAAEGRTVGLRYAEAFRRMVLEAED